jgi:hypothetical protein
MAYVTVWTNGYTVATSQPQPIFDNQARSKAIALPVEVNGLATIARWVYQSN